MNSKKSWVIPFIILFCSIRSYAQNKFILESEVPVGMHKDSFYLRLLDLFDNDTDERKLLSSLQRIRSVNGNIKFIVPIQAASIVVTDLPFANNLLAEPGDSIHISIAGDNVSITGRGCEKLIIANEARRIDKSIVRKTKNISKSENPVNDYLYYNNKYKESIVRKLRLVEDKKHAMSNFAYQYLRALFTLKEEIKIQDDFHELVNEKEKLGLTAPMLASLYDASLKYSPFHEMKMHLSDSSCVVGDLSGFLMYYSFYANQRSAGFIQLFNRSKERDSTIKYVLNEYEVARKNYSGLAWEKIATQYIRTIIKQLGFIPESNIIIKKYLADTAYLSYKESLKTFIKNKESLYKVTKAPDFSLMSDNGKSVSLADLKGKYVIMETWFTGCKGCVEMSNTIRRIESSLPDKSDIVFLNISVDEKKETWLKSVKQQKYTSGVGINVYTNGLGTRHSMIEAYAIQNYPTVFIIDPDGFIVPSTDPRIDEGRDITTLIKRKMAKKFDGPYILYKDRASYAYNILPDVEGNPEVTNASYPLTAVTESFDKKFRISLKDKLMPEPSEYAMPSKLLSLSDIEGNFEAFKNLLKVNGVIDSNYNWTYGKGHLVCNGDFFDRGEQVTECLWLIYTLEEKAKAKGGYVHFILGNHEIMNLNGNTAYTKPKYQMATALLNEKYIALWGNNSELGRWLRSKNIIEKIGDMVFVHGGIHPFINESVLSLSQINALLRPFYDSEEKIRKENDPDRLYFFRSKTSPFWYRGYYEKDYQGYDENKGIKVMASVAQVDSTLKKFDARIIITGHTIVADTISVHYDGKVINTDTHHAMGKSEALLYENGCYFRVDAVGDRIKILTAEPPGYRLSMIK